jgi:hypothetical protein
VKRVVLLLLAATQLASAQQVADRSYEPAIRKPAYAQRKGPLVLLDEAHVNFHTVQGRYAPFVQLLRRDGFVVRANRDKFTRSSLRDARVLVIANAVAKENEREWRVPIHSAFTDDEISAVRDWVRDGGSLLLIADHMPFGGAAAKLAAALGAEFSDGFAADSTGRTGQIRFRRAHGSLGNHPILDGRSPEERIDSLTTFTGQAFRLTGEGTPLIILGRGTTLLLPDVAWEFTESTKRLPAEGLLQGAAIELGKGRVVLLGEAAMNTAQIGGPQRNKMGMNHPGAAQNAQFVLNAMHWLVRLF